MTTIRLDGSRWWHYTYVIPVVDGTYGPERKICAPYDGAQLFRMWQVESRPLDDVRTGSGSIDDRSELKNLGVY